MFSVGLFEVVEEELIFIPFLLEASSLSVGVFWLLKGHSKCLVFPFHKNEKQIIEAAEKNIS